MDVHRILWKIALIGLVAVTFTGCDATPSAPDSADGTNGVSNPIDVVAHSDKVAVLLPNGGGPMLTAIRDGIEAAAEEYKLDVEFVLTPDGKPDEQVAMLQSSIRQTPPGICLYPTSNKIYPTLKDALASEIPVVILGKEASEQTDVLINATTDQFHCGGIMAKFLGESLVGKARILCVNCRADSASSSRLAGFQFALEESLGRLECVPVNCQSSIAESIRNTLDEAIQAENPFQAIVAFNLPSTQAALEATSSHGADETLNEIIICGFGSWDGAEKAIRDGHIAATVLEDPYMFGYTALMAIAHHNDGEEQLGDFITTGEHVVSIDNLEAPASQRLLDANRVTAPVSPK